MHSHRTVSPKDGCGNNLLRPAQQWHRNDGGHLREQRVSDPRRSRALWILGLVGALSAAGFWIWVLFVAPAAPQDKLNDASFPRAANPVCVAAIQDLDANHLLNQTAATPEARADLVERQDARLVTMVQQLRTMAPKSGDDGHAISVWLADWDQWLADRATWVTKLRDGRDVPFDEKADENGDPNSKALVAFAITNEMSACATPYGV